MYWNKTAKKNTVLKLRPQFKIFKAVRNWSNSTSKSDLVCKKQSTTVYFTVKKN